MNPSKPSSPFGSLNIGLKYQGFLKWYKYVKQIQWERVLYWLCYSGWFAEGSHQIDQGFIKQID
jgi:hypothetical protein